MSIVCVFIFISIHQRRYFPKVFEPVMYNHPMVFFSRPFGNKVRSKSSVIALCSAISNSNIYIPMYSKCVLHYVSNTHLHNIWTFPLDYNTAKKIWIFDLVVDLCLDPSSLWCTLYYTTLFYTRNI